MLKRLAILFSFLLASFSAQSQTTNWVAGQHYFLIQPIQPTWTATNKVEVLEVFSYGCPACNSFYSTAERLKNSLPANAQMAFLPASFNPAENWPTFQRAYLAAQTLGVADKAHKAMFDAIWNTGELGIVDQRTQRLKRTMPTIEDIAKLYNRVAGVPQDKFVAAANSVAFSMDTADRRIKAYRVDSTPTIVINGKYRLTAQSAGGVDQLIELVKFLVAKETKK